ncbi:MAG: SpoIIE family protein phosphatase [Balneolia bacterium]|nr:SpoIIE family protein phosphatase [Balneolia bacterium]
MAFKPANIIHKPGFQFTYFGVFGIIVFLLLRTSFDFNAGARIHKSGPEAEALLHSVNAQLGFESDSLNTVYHRFQDIRLFKSIEQELQGSTTPFQLNRNNVPINGWQVVLGGTFKEPDLVQGITQVFERIGYTKANLSDQGRVLSYENNPDRNLTFIEGEADTESITRIVEEVFRYDLTNYRQLAEEISQPGTRNNSTYDIQQIVFEKIAVSAPGPAIIRFNYFENVRDDLSGFSVHAFEVSYVSAEVDLATAPFAVAGNTLLLLVLSLIMIIILGTAIRQIFRGRMEWKRSLFIFGSVTLAQYIWQLLFLAPTYYGLYNADIVFTDTLQQLLIASFYGIYASFAYVAWESLARELKSGQIPVIDAVWGGKLMKKEVGAGILTGYGIAGIYFVIIALMFYSYDILMLQSDSFMMGFREPSTAAPAAAVFLNAWLSSMLFIIAQVGVAYNLIAFVVRKDSLRMLLTMIISGSTLFVIGPFFLSEGSVWQVFSIYLALSVPLVMAYRYFGIVSAIISWFVLLMGIRMLPYIGSESAFITGQSWLLFIILLTPFMFGLVSVLYGKNMKSYKEYVPEYEEKLNKRLRSEKELAIAKESQAALMPDTPPQIPGLDIHGFFVPSHEVGGDFYDFTILEDATGKPEGLALAIVDVSGKAMQSAFNAIFTSGLLLSRITSDSPAGVLKGINPILCDKTDEQTFITCQVGHIYLRKKTLTLANAGHCPPILKRDGSCSFIPLPAPRFPLGFRKGITYTDSETVLKSGDTLFFYSDGLPEAQSESGERLDFEKVKNYINGLDTRGRSAADICNEVKRYILEFSNYELADDTTLLIVKID